MKKVWLVAAVLGCASLFMLILLQLSVQPAAAYSRSFGSGSSSFRAEFSVRSGGGGSFGRSYGYGRTYGYDRRHGFAPNCRPYWVQSSLFFSNTFGVWVYQPGKWVFICR
ncbi:hypothetical protein C4552_03835 [Candidatus Parcubacteria bacterium]|nr:MAG: hypothetical protein C4552_03835 [Candidatus Parcubacteria bacterium]